MIAFPRGFFADVLDEVEITMSTTEFHRAQTSLPDVKDSEEAAPDKAREDEKATGRTNLVDGRTPMCQLPDRQQQPQDCKINSGCHQWVDIFRNTKSKR